MKKQPKLLIGIIAVIAVLVVVMISIVRAVAGGSRNTYSSHMELAQRYLDELQYEQAIAEFNAAIEIDPHNSEAYLGLADVYVAMGDMEKALEVLEKGFEQTGDERLVIKGTQISLDSISDANTIANDENIVISGVESRPSTGGLSIIIEDYEVFTDGFYHETPIDENSYSIVDFSKGISGHFSYSRELTEQEYENWGHGGEILDANGNTTNINASFYATSDGVFAVEFPEYMPKGSYMYHLYLIIDDEYCEARIAFTVE